MKKLLLCLALLIGLNDGTIVVFMGFPLVEFKGQEIIVQERMFSVDLIKAMRFVPDSAVM